MIYKVLLLPRAEKEISEAVDWYESKSAGLGKKFLFCVGEAVEILRKNPLQFQLKKKSFRQIKVDVFPYLIIFRVSGNEIIIHSVFNTWQNPLKKP